jgi:hypothetical protein
LTRPMRAIKPKLPGAALCPHDASEPDALVALATR